jgi:hypothetical protein
LSIRIFILQRDNKRERDKEESWRARQPPSLRRAAEDERRRKKKNGMKLVSVDLVY